MWVRIPQGVPKYKKMKKINIIKDCLSFDILSKDIDQKIKFTLMDVFSFIKRGSIDISLLSKIISCPCLKDYFEEIESREFKKSFDQDQNDKINYLELKTFLETNKNKSSYCWEFNGVGEKFGIDITLCPLYEISGYEIKINSKIENLIIKEKNFDFFASISVFEFLYNIFWELSFFGSPLQRDKVLKNLEKIVKGIKK